MTSELLYSENIRYKFRKLDNIKVDVQTDLGNSGTTSLKFIVVLREKEDFSLVTTNKYNVFVDMSRSLRPDGLRTCLSYNVRELFLRKGRQVEGR